MPRVLSKSPPSSLLPDLQQGRHSVMGAQASTLQDRKSTAQPLEFKANTGTARRVRAALGTVPLAARPVNTVAGDSQTPGADHLLAFLLSWGLFPASPSHPAMGQGHACLGVFSASPPPPVTWKGKKACLLPRAQHRRGPDLVVGPSSVLKMWMTSLGTRPLVAC